jgi:hypothetical protein
MPSISSITVIMIIPIVSDIPCPVFACSTTQDIGSAQARRLFACLAQLRASGGLAGGTNGKREVWVLSAIRAMNRTAMDAVGREAGDSSAVG